MIKMNVTKVVVVILLLLTTKGVGQDVGISYENGNFRFLKNSKACLFGNNVRLREKPSTESKELKTLQILEKVVLVERTEVKKVINGLESYWVKVQAGASVGYILDYFISSSCTQDRHISYLSRLNVEKGKKYLEFRKVFKGKDGQFNADVIKIDVPHADLSIQTLDNKGLIGVSKIIFIKYWAEACGVIGGGEYLFINNGEIIDRIVVENISDAGVFWKSETLIFPYQNQNLNKNSVQFIQEIGNVIDESSLWYEKKIIERQHQLIEGKFVPAFKSKLE